MEEATLIAEVVDAIGQCEEGKMLPELGQAYPRHTLLPRFRPIRNDEVRKVSRIKWRIDIFRLWPEPVGVRVPTYYWQRVEEEEDIGSEKECSKSDVNPA